MNDIDEQNKIDRLNLKDTKITNNFESALKLCDGGLNKPINEIFVTGGRTLYKNSITKKECS